MDTLIQRIMYGTLLSMIYDSVIIPMNEISE